MPFVCVLLQRNTKRMENKDYIIRATAANGSIRAFAATTKNMTEYARSVHHTSPVATAAIGRTLTAAAMMGLSMKNEKDLLTIQIRGNGCLGGVTVTADSHGYVKGYVEEPLVLLPPNALGKLDVGGAIGQGQLTVIKDMGLKDPYVGTVDLQSGEIADDLTYYFALSEQVPSSVALGVLLNKENHVQASGGFIIQLMPFAEEAVINKLEENLKNIKSITELLNTGHTPESILELILGDMDLIINETSETGFRCNCSKERVSRALLSLGKNELTKLIDEEKPVEVNCHFCNSDYSFDKNELMTMLREAKR